MNPVASGESTSSPPSPSSFTHPGSPAYYNMRDGFPPESSKIHAFQIMPQVSHIIICGTGRGDHPGRKIAHRTEGFYSWMCTTVAGGKPLNHVDDAWL